jgi:PAS domain S-box-containing protein
MIPPVHSADNSRFQPSEESAVAEARAQLALESAEVGIWDWDLIRGDVAWDPRCRVLFDVEDALSYSLELALSRVHPADRARLDEAIRAALDPSVAASFEMEYRVRHRDGAEYWIHAKGRVLWQDGAGEPMRCPRRFIGTVRDVSRWRRTELALTERDERLRAALYASRTGTFRWDIRTNALDWDENLDRLFGLPEGKTVRSLDGFLAVVHPDDRARVVLACQRCATSGADFDEEFRVVWPDGSIHWLDDKGRTFLGDDGQPLYMTGACVETTDRRRAEEEREALLEAQRIIQGRLRRILDAGIVGTFFWSIHGTLTDANDAFLDMLGYTRADLEAGRVDWRALTPAEWYESDVTYVSELYETGRHGPYEKEYRAKDGRRVPVLIASAFFDGSREHGVSLCLDLTKRRAAEVALVQREHQLREALDAAQVARAEAEAANRAKSQFLATMSHELRTPLNAIGGYAQLLEMGVRGPITAEQRADLERIRRSQAHLLGLINDVLNFAKLDAGAVTFHLADVVVSEVLAAAEAMVAPQMAARGLRFSIGGCPDALRVRADAEKVRQVLLNLLGNALKFTDPGGAVTVECQEHDARTVAVVVGDTGYGIPADRLEMIFDPFVQVGRQLSSANEGVGLGLAISRELARGMGGDLTVRSVVGEGSSFTLTLPRA